MYIAALRIADDFGLDAVGIQYQQGLKDIVPASDLAEGLLNNAERPPVRSPRRRARALRRTRRCRTSTRSTRASRSTRWSPTGSGPRWASTRPPPCTTSAGATSTTAEFVWVFEISGSVPASHNGGYDKSYEHAPAADVLPARRRHASAACPSRARSSGRGCSSWTASCTPTSGARHRRRAARRGDPAPAGRHHAAVADHARRAARRHPRPADGPAQGQPLPASPTPPTRRPPTARWSPRRRCSTRSASRVHLCGDEPPA